MEEQQKITTGTRSRGTRGQFVMVLGFSIVIALMVVTLLVWRQSVEFGSVHIMHMNESQDRSRELLNLRNLAHEHTIQMYRSMASSGESDFSKALELSKSEREAFGSEAKRHDEMSGIGDKDQDIWRRLNSIVSDMDLVERRVQDLVADNERGEARRLIMERLIPLQEKFNAGVNDVIEYHQGTFDTEITTAEMANRGSYLVIFLLSAMALLLAGLMVFAMRRTARAEEQVVQHNERIRALYELASKPGLTAEQQNQDLLREGCRLLGTEIGKLCGIDIEQKIVQFVDTWCIPELDVKPGTQLPLEKTFCSIVFQTDRGIAVSDVGKSEYRSYPCYEFSRLESYIAAPIWVDGKRFGTVNFSSRTPRTVPFTDTDRDLVNLIGRSITMNLERARMQEILLAKETAEAESRTKSSFLASMSHELRTPLNAIIGYSELLIEDAKDRRDDSSLPDLNKIRYSGLYLLSLIDDVLDFSKLESDKIELHFEYVDGKRLISEISESVTTLIQKNKNRMEVTVSENLGMLFCDIKRTRQILFNLLSNAAKFTDRGVVTLNARREGAGKNNFVVFEISDTGIGISQQQQENLFKPFGQADQGIARKFGGTGLGLVISRRFTQLMGGDLTLKSELGKGSRFTVTLPTDVQRRKQAGAR